MQSWLLSQWLNEKVTGTLTEDMSSLLLLAVTNFGLAKFMC